MKIALLSDGHLFQTLCKEYDPVSEFRKVIEQVKELSPDLVIFAGDMFDQKKAPSIYVRHYEGEREMVKIRPMLKDLGTDILVLRGNHERREVLESIAQTVDNFRYKGDSSVEKNGLRIWLLDSRYEEGREEGEKAIERACAEARKERGMKVLITHESFSSEGAIRNEIVRKAAGVFDFVFNGHMHCWKPIMRNVYLLPSLLPSRLVWGAYWVEKYVWEAEKEMYDYTSRESPFGFIVLDTEKKEPEFVPFNPSMKTIEVSLGISGLSLEEAKERMRRMLEEVSKKKDAIVLPEIHGEASFLPIALESVIADFKIPRGETRIEGAKFSPMAGARIETTVFSLSDIEQIVREEAEKVAGELGAKRIIGVFQKLLDEGVIENPPKTIETRLRELIDPLLEGIKKPEFFEEDIKEILSMDQVKKR